MKKVKKSKIFKLCLTCLFVTYVSFIFVKQQYALNSYKNEKEYITKQIEQQSEYKDELLAKKEDVNSKDYIEEIAREKLNMYLPNERVYVDVGN